MRRTYFSPPATSSPSTSSPYRARGGVNNTVQTTFIQNNSPSSRRYESPTASSTLRSTNKALSPRNYPIVTDPKRQALETEIRQLEEQILKTKLRGEWANRRMVALETTHHRDNDNPKATLFLMERRAERSKLAALIDREENLEYPLVASPGRASGLYPSTKDLHADVSIRIEKVEAEGRRIRDQINEVQTLRETQEGSHREKLYNLRRRRDNIRERKLVVESQLRVIEGELRDDDELSDKQYKRYATRLETARQDSLRRHDTSLKVQTERSDLRCSMIQKETDDILHSMQKLITEKEKDLALLNGRENDSYEAASHLGDRVSEVENATFEISRLQKKAAVLEIEQEQVTNELEIINQEIGKSHYLLYEVEGKIDTNQPESDKKARAQEASLEALRMSVRTLQQRIAVASKRRRADEFDNNVSSFQGRDGRNSAERRQNSRNLAMLDTKLGELNEVNHVNSMQLLDREQELAKLSNIYNDLDSRYREACLEGEYLYAKIAKYRNDFSLNDSRRDVQQERNRTNLTGALAAGSLFSTLAGRR